jgi:hypothetical protein
MSGFAEQIRRAEARYYNGQLIGLFLCGLSAGGFIGWLLWG